MINIDALNDDEKLAALESIHKSIAESKEIQKKKITTNVELIVKALKKIESDLKQRYDETGQLIANLKNGEDGRDGKDGKDGKNGKDGRDGLMGPRGYDGVPGRNGLDGADGVSVTDAHIDFDGSLIISLSSGRVINVGEVVAADIAEKIKVITNGGGTSQGVLDAIASLQAQIDSIASGLEYQGTWNASTNVPTLASSVGTAGYYYIVATAGSTNLNGVTDWQVGDWAVFNGTVWQKIDQTNLVTSVAGRTGAITLTTADIGGLGTIATQNASNVSITGGSITGITDLAIADGGTGASTAAAAITALTGTQTSGYYLRSNGTSAALSAISAVDVPTLNQNTTGTAAGLSATLGTNKGGTGLTSFTTYGVLYATSTSVLETSGLLKFETSNSALTIASTTTSNGYMGFTNSADGGAQGYIGDAKALITPAINSALAVRGEDAILFGIASTEGMRLNSTGLGIGKTAGSALDVKGTLRLSGSTSGYVGLAPAATAGSTTYTLPSADGTNGQSLTTNGSGTLSWASGTGGTVTSVSGTGTVSGISLSGTVTSSGNLTLGGALDLSAYGGAGAFTTLSATGAITSTLATGTAPLVIASTTKVANLNVDLLDGADWASPAALGSTTPAAVSATTLSASSTVTLSGGTANGVTYLNGSKVLTSGSALVFDGTNLSVGTTALSGGKFSTLADLTAVNGLVIRDSATTYANNDNYVLLQNSIGSTAGGLTHPASQSLGVWGFDNLRFLQGSGATEQMRLTSTGLGIGTSSPSAKVHSSLSSSGATSETLRLDNPSDSANAGTKLVYRISGWSFDGGFASLTRDGSSGGTIMAFGTSANASTTNASEKLRIDSAGNVGIGTSSPSAKLNVFAGGVVARFGAFGTTTYDDFQIESYAGSTGIGCRGSSNLYFAMNGTTRMYLTSSGNFGIGTSSPSYPLHIVSTSTTTAAFKNSTAANSQIIVGNTAGDLQIRALASGDSLIFSDTSKYLAFGTNGATERMRLDSSGNLGLGVTPSAWGTGYKAIQLLTSSLYGTTSRDMNLGANVYVDAVGYKYIQTSFATNYTQYQGVHSWYNAPSGTAGNAITFTQAMTLDASGNLGIGTTTPSSRLTVSNSSGGNVASFTNTSTADLNINLTSGVTLLTPSTGTLAFGTSSTERARIDSSGNLLVGTTSSAGKLTVVGGTTSLSLNGAGTQTVLKLNNDDTTVGTNAVKLGFTSSGVVKASINVAVYNNDYMAFNVGSDTERARIDSSGNLLVGTTGGSGAWKLYAVSGATQSACLFENPATSGQTVGKFTRTASDGTAISFSRGGSDVGTISITTTATAYNTSSDYRLKENIQDAESASTLIDSLQVRQFDWKADGSHQRYGFVAQELVTVAPEAVHQPEDTDEMMAVDYSKLVPMLVKEIQSLRKRLADAGL